jgi:hypothetical protein
MWAQADQLLVPESEPVPALIGMDALRKAFSGSPSSYETMLCGFSPHARQVGGRRESVAELFGRSQSRTAGIEDSR